MNRIFLSGKDRAQTRKTIYNGATLRKILARQSTFYQIVFKKYLCGKHGPEPRVRGWMPRTKIHPTTKLLATGRFPCTQRIAPKHFLVTCMHITFRNAHTLRHRGVRHGATKSHSARGRADPGWGAPRGHDGDQNAFGKPFQVNRALTQHASSRPNPFSSVW